MWRRLAIAALCVALGSPLWAQIRSAPSRGAGSMGRSGFSSGGSIGVHRGSAGNQGFGIGFGAGGRSPFFRPPFVGIRQPFFGGRGFHHRRSFFPVSPFYFGYYGYPAFYGSYSYSTLDSYPGYGYYSSYSVQNDVARQQQDIDRLEDEVARLREQRESSRENRFAPTYDYYAGYPSSDDSAREQQEIDRLEREAARLRQQRDARKAAPAGPPVAGKTEPSIPTLLVFRDKHTQEVHNYAVVGGTLWIFSEQRATKLPLSWLDIDATAKANDDRGVDFQIPK